MLSDEWLQRYRLLENFTAKWNGNGNGNGNGNAYDRGDYNSSFALRAVELKMGFTGVHIIFLIFALKHKLWVLVRIASIEAVLTSTHNFCFREQK